VLEVVVPASEEAELDLRGGDLPRLALARPGCERGQVVSVVLGG
jgi:hypothetical protein